MSHWWIEKEREVLPCTVRRAIFEIAWKKLKITVRISEKKFLFPCTANEIEDGIKFQLLKCEVMTSTIYLCNGKYGMVTNNHSYKWCFFVYIWIWAGIPHSFSDGMLNMRSRWIFSGISTRFPISIYHILSAFTIGRPKLFIPCVWRG